MGKSSEQAVQGLFREDLGAQGPGNRKALSTDPQAEPHGGGGREWGEQGGDRDSRPSPELLATEGLAKSQHETPASSPLARSGARPRSCQERAAGAGQEGHERGEGAQNEVSPVPIRAAGCSGITACMNVMGVLKGKFAALILRRSNSTSKTVLQSYRMAKLPLKRADEASYNPAEMLRHTGENYTLISSSAVRSRVPPNVLVTVTVWGEEQLCTPHPAGPQPPGRTLLQKRQLGMRGGTGIAHAASTPKALQRQRVTIDVQEKREANRIKPEQQLKSCPFWSPIAEFVFLVTRYMDTTIQKPKQN